MYLTLAEAKQHIVVDADYIEDDSYILGLIDVAENVVSRHLDIPLSQLEDENGALPSPVLHAVKYLVEQMYANRGPVSFAAAFKIPYTYDYLIGLYRNYSVS